jgi:hypothetical protein
MSSVRLIIHIWIEPFSRDSGSGPHLFKFRTIELLANSSQLNLISLQEEIKHLVVELQKSQGTVRENVKQANLYFSHEDETPNFSSQITATPFTITKNPEFLAAVIN